MTGIFRALMIFIVSKKASHLRRNEDVIHAAVGTLIKCFLVIIPVLFIVQCASAQNRDSLIHALLLDIQSSQVKKDEFFYRGAFPSYRQCGGAPHNYQPDNTVFYTAITAFALRNMLPYLDGDGKAIAENIIKEARISYPLYRNKHGYPYYGFWATKDPIMPGTYYFKYLKQVS